MKKQLFSIGLLIAIIPAVQAQQKVKDGTLTGTATLPNADAVLELESNNKGMMLPRVALTDTSLAAPLSAHVKGMVVYDTATNAATGIAPGIYYNDGTRWVRANGGTAPVTAWQLLGNAGTTPPTAIDAATGGANYWGTSDAKNLALGTNGITRMIFDTAGNAYGGTHGSYVPTVTTNGGNNRNFIWGRNNTVSDPTALGNNNANAIFGANNKVIGGGLLFGSTNVVGGGANTLAASASAVFGGNNTDSALYTVMGGRYNTIAVPGANSIVVGGEQNAANGNYLSGGSSAVFGKANKDSAYYTLAAGQNNIIGASGTGSVVLGSGNTVNGAQAAALGQGTVAASNTELAAGRYNSFTTGNALSWDGTDPLLQLGAGVDNANRANALTVLKNGHTAIGMHTTKPNSTLQVNGSVSTAIVTVNNSYTLTDTDYTVIYTGGSTAPTFTLPDPTTCKGRMYRLVNAAGTGNYQHVTLSRPVNLYTGNTTTMLSLNTFTTAPLNESSIANTAIIQSDGINWWRVGL